MLRSAIDSISVLMRRDSAAGLVLIAAALAALLISNSPLGAAYSEVLSLPVRFQAGTLELAKPLRLWIDDGLMAVFFLLVGLELKREVLQGGLSSPAKVALPVAAAMGGMLVPAVLYSAINAGDAVALRGWAIPMATDIAFALGILALLGRRVPTALRLFLAAIAIADDLGAILVIAIAYTDRISGQMLMLAGAAILCLVALNRSRVTSLTAYAIVGVFLWLFVLKSGVHATLAGVVVAFAIPLTGTGESPLERLEHALHPWVAFGILPVFALANAGVDLSGIGFGVLVQGIPFGIIVGLVAGKLVGVFGASALVIGMGWARLPEGANWTSLLGISALCGIGFTMSLFIGTLAFGETEEARMQGVRLGVLAGSLVAGILGAVLLLIGTKSPPREPVRA